MQACLILRRRFPTRTVSVPTYWRRCGASKRRSSAGRAAATFPPTIGKNFAKQRIANGYPQPHNVRYWSIGNENWGGHEIGAKCAEEWGRLVRGSAKMMVRVDPTIELSAASIPDLDWNLNLLRTAGQYLDWISIHGYWGNTVNGLIPDDYHIVMLHTGEDISVAIDRVRAYLTSLGLGKQIKIAYDEWNLRSWHHPGHGMLRQGFDLEARRNNDINSTYTMADAVFSACFLNSCLRHSDVVDIACFSPIVNTRGAIRVDRDGITRRTTYYTFYMYTNMLEKYMVPVSLTCPNLTYENQQTPVLDAVLTSDKEGKRFVYAIVNKDPDNSTSLTIDFASMNKKAPKKLNGWVLSGRSADDYNDRGDEHVKPEQHTFRVSNGSVTIPPHTVAFITVE